MEAPPRKLLDSFACAFGDQVRNAIRLKHFTARPTHASEATWEELEALQSKPMFSGFAVTS